MSRAQRLAAADGQIVRGAPQLGLNSAGVPGGLGAVPRPAPFLAGGVRWEPVDAAPHAAPIGYALAAQLTPPRPTPTTSTENPT